MFKYEISSHHVPTIVHLINMILKGSILFFSCVFRQKPRMISACSLLTHTPTTWTTPWMSAVKKQVFPSGWAFRAYLNSAFTKMTPNTPSQFRSFAAILARWGIVCFFIFSWPPHNLPSSNKTKQTQQLNNLCKSTIHLKISAKHPRQFCPQSYSFVRATAELELAQYMLKSDDLMLHPEFLQRLRSLPQAYVYGEYRQIFKDYGTHYITEASLGGEYEHTIILNKERLEKSGNKYQFIGHLVSNQINFFSFLTYHKNA